MMMSMALAGSNGNQETNIGTSRSLEYSIYDDGLNEIPVNDLATPIDYWIGKDPSVPITPYKYVNAINASQLNSSQSLAYLNDSLVKDGFMVTGLSLTGANVSVHIQLKPLNKSLNYLTLVKFGDNPALVNQFYDKLTIFCPSDLLSEANDSFYLTFLNMSQVDGFKGYFGLAIREIDTSLVNCQNKYATTNDMLIDSFSSKNQTFTSDYLLRIYTAGCYYSDPITYEWSSLGMEILSDTSITQTHCQSNHLTSFAGGFIVLPPAIDFNKAFANASFLDNPVIYSTVIALICIYALLAIWARWMDVKDSKKQGVTLLGDEAKCENKEEKYAYEILVFTGGRMHAGTKSKVFIKFLYFILF
jgi:hypothetical protein